MRFTVLACVFVAAAQYSPAAASSGHASWGYEGETGPDSWGHIDMGGSNECAMRRQSPIDIETMDTVYDASMGPLRLVGHDRVAPSVTVVNNGHTVQLSSDEWSQRLSGGPLRGDYRLLQMHFHWGKDLYRGSEHTVNGKRYPIELHLVHVATNLTGGQPNYPGAIAVLAVFFDVTKANANAGVEKIARVIGDLPAEQQVSLKSEFSPSMVLPSTKDFFTYEGSLTTPPCSQVVTWLVLRQPLKITEKELNAFRSTRFTDGTPMVDNFRPVQPINGRQVRVSFMTGSSKALVSSAIVVVVCTLIGLSH